MTLAEARKSLSGALIITRREVRDQLRDWRIIAPVIILTLFFPLLMNFTAGQAVGFVERYGAPVIGQRLVPFLLMIVGFFPISISLVIALESFVGEKERHSLEPLLSSPLTDTQLYIGKTLAAMLPPLLAAYLGILVYLVGLALTIQWHPDLILLLQILMLTGIQALVMVAGAVVISSQTTSVRAANLLASFIIIPMAMLVQGESLIMFWAQYTVLWWVILGLVLITLVLIRMGVRLFNREELLGRDIDEINVKAGWRTFAAAFRGAGQGPGLRAWYRGTIAATVRRLAWPMGLVAATLLLATLLGMRYACGLPAASDCRQPERSRGKLQPQPGRAGFCLCWRCGLGVLYQPAGAAHRHHPGHLLVRGVGRGGADGAAGVDRLFRRPGGAHRFESAAVFRGLYPAARPL